MERLEEEPNVGDKTRAPSSRRPPEPALHTHRTQYLVIKTTFCQLKLTAVARPVLCSRPLFGFPYIHVSKRVNVSCHASVRPACGRPWVSE